MPRILDYNGNEAVRTVTVADLVALRHQNRQLAQVTTGSFPDNTEVAQIDKTELAQFVERLNQQ